MALLARANELAEQGRDVIHLEIGEPDFPTPGPVLAAAQSALQQGMTRYTDSRGIQPLRDQVSGYYARRYGVDVSPERIFITAGASGGLLLVTALLINPGENLLMTDPGYPCNRHFLAAFEGDGLLVPVDSSTDYQLSPELVDEYWDANSRGVLVATPSNPTGSVLSPAGLAALSDAVSRHGGHMIVDEIYQGLVYGNDPPVSVLAINDDAIVVNSFSKYFGMTGWRLGWVVVPAGLAESLERLAQNLFICPSAISQYAALGAFDPECLDLLEARRQELEARKSYLVPALRDLGFDIPVDPQGAFYVYARLPAGYDDSETFCARLLEEEFVAITPGTDFGEYQANQMVRFSYAVGLPRLKEAVERIQRMLS